MQAYDFIVFQVQHYTYQTPGLEIRGTLQSTEEKRQELNRVSKPFLCSQCQFVYVSHLYTLSVLKQKTNLINLTNSNINLKI